ncbi:MAG TPA: ABC transporter permease, partial [Cyclobacteriaceae bacterium]|nr:ABC transporter permease [Cyclobacteriaceae bacterium]
MIQRYIILSLRNLWKYKFLTIINIIGLSISISLSFIVLSSVKTAFDADGFHPSPERTYRIITKQYLTSGSATSYATSSYRLAQYLTDNYPWIESTSQIIRAENQVVKRINSNDEYKLETVIAEPNFFNFFGQKLEIGDATSALSDPYNCLISKSTASLLFGKVNPLGQSINIGNLGEFNVTGIFEEPPTPSRMSYPVVVSKSTIQSLSNNKSFDPSSNWSDIFQTYTFVMLTKETQKEKLEDALLQTSTYSSGDSEPSKLVDHILFEAQSFNDFVYSPELLLDSVNAKTLPILSMIISVLILLLAAFNYTNLTTSRVMSKINQIGVQQVWGATQYNLMKQFMVEGIIVTLLSFSVALLLQFVIPLFSVFYSIGPDGIDVTLMIIFLTFSIALGMMCGIFPVLIISKVKIIDSLKNKISGRTGTPLWQQLLIVIQFSVSLLAITIALVIAGQTKFIESADYGVDRKDIVNIRTIPVDIDYFKTKLSEQSNVELVSASSGRPIFTTPSNCIVKSGLDSIETMYISVDANFSELYGLSFVTGYNYPADSYSQSETSVILNQAAVERLGFETPQRALGEIVFIDSLQLKIIGVVKDFHFQRLKSAIQPLLLRNKPSEFRSLAIKTFPGKQNGALEVFKIFFNSTAHNYPLEYYIFEDEFHEDNFTKSSESNTVVGLTIISVLISCLGLVGVVMFNLKSKAKE